MTEEEIDETKYNDENIVFVGGIHWKANEEDLMNCFSQFGEVERIKLIRDKTNNNHSRGYGFVTFKSADVAQTVREQNFITLFDKKMNVGKAYFSKPQETSQKSSLTAPTQQQQSVMQQNPQPYQRKPFHFLAKNSYPNKRTVFFEQQNQNPDQESSPQKDLNVSDTDQQQPQQTGDAADQIANNNNGNNNASNFPSKFVGFRPKGTSYFQKKHIPKPFVMNNNGIPFAMGKPPMGFGHPHAHPQSNMMNMPPPYGVPAGSPFGPFGPAPFMYNYVPGNAMPIGGPRMMQGHVNQPGVVGGPNQPNGAPMMFAPAPNGVYNLSPGKRNGGFYPNPTLVPGNPEDPNQPHPYFPNQNMFPQGENGPQSQYGVMMNPSRQWSGYKGHKQNQQSPSETSGAQQDSTSWTQQSNPQDQAETQQSQQEGDQTNNNGDSADQTQANNGNDANQAGKQQQGMPPYQPMAYYGPYAPQDAYGQGPYPMNPADPYFGQSQAMRNGGEAGPGAGGMIPNFPYGPVPGMNPYMNSPFGQGMPFGNQTQVPYWKKKKTQRYGFNPNQPQSVSSVDNVAVGGKSQGSNSPSVQNDRQEDFVETEQYGSVEKEEDNSNENENKETEQ